MKFLILLPLRAIYFRTLHYETHCKQHEFISLGFYYIGLGHTGPIKVNLEFSSSFFGFSFLGLDPKIYSGFKPEMHFIFQFNLFFSNCWLLVFGFLQGSAVKPEVWTFFPQLIIALWLSNIELWFLNLGFINYVFNSQFLTKADISFSRFPNFKPKKTHFQVYFNRPTIECI